ncbi:hypothetical protein BCR44DRAFT_73041 [Catenaria anguillulae PL171]|uniref:Uncharacterized protein n=1 Tax=Catenaria anguillulae PL171 TaxID=765915 RepID=A0A1Y2I4T3_9FUNG|nr:hypothetical protein BCR44DRAFT_73041 [Catenaria anguillulae PL171]
MYSQYHHQHHHPHFVHHQPAPPPAPYLQPYAHVSAHGPPHTHAHGHLYIGSQAHGHAPTHSHSVVGGGSPSVGVGGGGGGVSSSANIHFHGGTIDPLVAAWIWAEIHLSPFVFLSSSALQHMVDLQRPALVDLAAASIMTPGALSGGPSFAAPWNFGVQSQSQSQSQSSSQAYPGISSLSSSPSPCPPSSSLSSSWTSCTSTASSSSISSRSPVLAVGSTSASSTATRRTPMPFQAFAASDHLAHRSFHATNTHSQQPDSLGQGQDAPRIDRSPTWRARAALYRQFAQLYPDHFKSLVAPPPTASQATSNPYAYGYSSTPAYHDLDSYFAPRAYGSALSSSSPPRYHASTSPAAMSMSPYLGHCSASYTCDPDAPDPLLTMVAARMIRSPVSALFPSDGWSPAYLSPYWARSLRSCSGLITSVQKIALAKAVFDHEGDVCGVKLTVKGLVPDGAPGATELVATATVTTTATAASAARVVTTPAAGGASAKSSTPKKPANASAACSPKPAKSPSSPKIAHDTAHPLPASALTPIFTLCRILVGPGRYPVHTITDCFAFVLGVSLSSAWLALAPLPTLHPPATRPGQPKLSTLDLLVAKLGGSGGGPAMVSEWQCEISAASMGHSAFLKSCGAGGATSAASPVSVRVLPGGAARLRGKWNARPVPPHTGEFMFDDIPGIQEYMRWVADLVAEDAADLVEATRTSLPINSLADHPDKDALALVEHEIRAMAVSPQLIAPADPPAPHALLVGLDCFSIWKRNAAWTPLRMPLAAGSKPVGYGREHQADRMATSPLKKKKRADSAVSMGGSSGKGTADWHLAAALHARGQLADEAVVEEADVGPAGGRNGPSADGRKLPKLGSKDAHAAALPAKRPLTVSPV